METAITIVLIIVYVIAGGPIILNAARNIRRGEVFDENFLMVIATFGAIALGEYGEAVMVMVLYRIGEYLQDRAILKSHEAIDELSGGSEGAHEHEHEHSHGHSHSHEHSHSHADAHADTGAERFITRFAKIYTPIVCGIALVIAVIPPLFTGGWSEWIYKALTVLIISCPCALVISIPLGFCAGIGGAAGKGILMRSSNELEQIAKADAAALEKLVVNGDASELRPEAVRISKKTMRVIYENIGFSIGIKLVVLLLTALGFTNMWLAVFADEGVCLLAILNAMRARF